MKLSTKSRYGTRAMLELALNYGKGPVLIRDIARGQEISDKYLEHILIPLKNAGLVKSIRGAKGGYTLSKSPEEIKLNHIVQVLEGSIAPVDCVDEPGACKRSSFCVTRDVWSLMEKTISQLLYSITLKDLVQRHERKSATRPLDYNI